MCHLLKQVFLYSLIFYFSHIFCHMKFCVCACVCANYINYINEWRAGFYQVFSVCFLIFLGIWESADLHGCYTVFVFYIDVVSSTLQTLIIRKSNKFLNV